MPRRNRVPTYRLHKPSRQAVVTLGGKDYYLGRHGSAVSRREYARLIGEWSAAGGQAPEPPGTPVTVSALVARYFRHAARYYEGSNEAANIMAACKPLRRLYGSTTAAEFGPRGLRAVQDAMIREGWTRAYVNRACSRIRRVFRWGVGQELVPAATWHALRAVDPLRKGRSAAKEAPPVLPVDPAAVEAVLPHLGRVVAAMVELQRLTGMRPGEVCILRPRDVDTSGAVWTYRPFHHKTEHHGRDRVVFIGPKGQDVLRRFLVRPPEAFCFSPAESEADRLAERHARRQTPESCGNRPGTNRKRQPRRKPGERYTPDTYRRRVWRGCDLAHPAPEGTAGEALARWRQAHRWNPHQLRHLAATELRRQFGLEVAQVVLGHARADVTQVYAERDEAKAREAMAKVG